MFQCVYYQQFQTRKDIENYQFGTVDLQIYSEPVVIKEKNIHCFYLDLQNIDETNVSHLKLLLLSFLISDSFIWHTDDQIVNSLTQELSVFQKITEKLGFKFNYLRDEYLKYPKFYYLVKGQTPHKIKKSSISPKGYLLNLLREEQDDILQDNRNSYSQTTNLTNSIMNQIQKEYKSQYILQQRNTKDYVLSETKFIDFKDQDSGSILSYNSSQNNDNYINQQMKENLRIEKQDSSKQSQEYESVASTKTQKHLSNQEKDQVKYLFNDQYISKVKLVFYRDIVKSSKIRNNESNRHRGSISTSNNSHNSFTNRVFDSQFGIQNFSQQFQQQPSFAQQSSRHYRKSIQSPLYIKHSQIQNGMHFNSVITPTQNGQNLNVHETIEDLLQWNQSQVLNAKRIGDSYYNSRMFINYLQILIEQINSNKIIDIQKIHNQVLSKECEEVSKWCYEQFVEEMLVALGDQLKPIDQFLFISLQFNFYCTQYYLQKQIRENTINKYCLYFIKIDFRENSPFISYRKKLKKYIDSYTKRMFELYLTTMAGHSEIKRKQISRRLFAQFYEKPGNSNGQQGSRTNIKHSLHLNRDTIEMEESEEVNTSQTESTEYLEEKEDIIIDEGEDFGYEDARVKEIKDSKILLRSNLGQEDLESKYKVQKMSKGLFKQVQDPKMGIQRGFSIYQNLQVVNTTQKQRGSKQGVTSKLMIPSKSLIQNSSEIQPQRSIRSLSQDENYGQAIKNEELQLNEEKCKQNKLKLTQIFDQALTLIRQFNENYFFEKDDSAQCPSIAQYQHFIRHTYKKYIENFSSQYTELYQKIKQQEEFLRFKDLKQMRDILFNRNEILMKQEKTLVSYIEGLKNESQNTFKLVQQTNLFNNKNKDKYKLSLILHSKEEECKKLEEELERLKAKKNPKK